VDISTNEADRRLARAIEVGVTLALARLISGALEELSGEGPSGKRAPDHWIGQLRAVTRGCDQIAEVIEHDISLDAVVDLGRKLGDELAAKGIVAEFESAGMNRATYTLTMTFTPQAGAPFDLKLNYEDATAEAFATAYAERLAAA
jgi:hypothetical protein